MYRKAADAAAKNNLGVLYRDGVGVGKDLNTALAWFQKSARQGYTKAMINLGAIYEEAARAARMGK
jgi:hypothetical protein